jgi:hypothetical protein
MAISVPDALHPKFDADARQRTEIENADFSVPIGADPDVVPGEEELPLEREMDPKPFDHERYAFRLP